MNKRRVIGFGFLALAVIFFLSFYPSLALTNPIGEAFQKDGSKVVCDVSFDRDSVHGATCAKVDTCRTGFPFFLGIGEQDVTVRLIAGNGQRYAQESKTTFLGVNDNVQLSGCVPSTLTGGTVQVLDESGVIKASKAVTFQ